MEEGDVHANTVVQTCRKRKVAELCSSDVICEEDTENVCLLQPTIVFTKEDVASFQKDNNVSGDEFDNEEDTENVCLLQPTIDLSKEDVVSFQKDNNVSGDEFDNMSESDKMERIKSVAEAFIQEHGDLILDENNDDNDDLPLLIQIMEKQFKQRHHCRIRTDLFTNRKYRLLNQPNTPGTGHEFRGIGVMMEEDVPWTGVGELLLISDYPGEEILDEQERKEYLDRGNYILNNRGYSFSTGAMKVNTRSIWTLNIAEKSNVSLRVLHSDSLKGERYNVRGLKEGYYAVITSTRGIKSGTFLILEDYGQSKDLPFGSPKFLACQNISLKLYKEQLSVRPVGGTVCKVCCNILTSHQLQKNRRVTHNLHCKSYAQQLFQSTSEEIKQESKRFKKAKR